MPPRKKQRVNTAKAHPASDYVGAASTAAQSSPPPVHLPLHRHALESIFAFLSFTELRSAVLVSNRWLAAVSSMRGLEKGKHLTSIAAGIPTSTLARHVNQLGDALVLSPSQLQEACRAMPFLSAGS